MKKILLATSAAVALGGFAQAQDLTVGGFLEFESHYGENYDVGADPADDQVTQLDFAVDGRLNFDYSNSTKSGLEYGAHFELDLYQSDDDPATTDFALPPLRNAGPVLAVGSDIAFGDVVEFNDGYVFLNSALGNLAFGDTGIAGEATNQLHVPILPMGAQEVDQYAILSEAEQIFYSITIAGIDVEVSTDDDSHVALGVGYGASLGGVDVELGLSAMRYQTSTFGAATGDVASLAGSLQASSNGLTTGVNYASVDIDKWQTIEYISTGLSYEFGALMLGAGVETSISHLSFLGDGNETYTTNVFAGASYELADGLILALGIGNLDADSQSNRVVNIARGFNPNRARVRTTNAIFSAKVEF